jgi:5-hydroxyisourate hydrolase
MAERPFITCHVLDTTTGKPARGIAVTLEPLAPPITRHDGSKWKWSGTTNEDGRVTTWHSISGEELKGFVALFKKSLDDGKQMLWTLRFNVADYYGAENTFWPEVVLQFAAKKQEEHYHVPLLLGPWSYTTYRGS